MAVFIAAAIGVVGYLAYDRTQETNKTPTVSGTKDLDVANKTLEDTNLDASTTDTTELDSELNNF
ncbi:MAG TPA: hypothetical protein VIS56_00970 [Candidatus Saccharimonadales bacterium]